MAESWRDTWGAKVGSKIWYSKKGLIPWALFDGALLGVPGAATGIYPTEHGIVDEANRDDFDRTSSFKFWRFVASAAMIAALAAFSPLGWYAVPAGILVMIGAYLAHAHAGRFEFGRGFQ